MGESKKAVKLVVTSRPVRKHPIAQKWLAKKEKTRKKGYVVRGGSCFLDFFLFLNSLLSCTNTQQFSTKQKIQRGKRCMAFGGPTFVVVRTAIVVRL